MPQLHGLPTSNYEKNPEGWIGWNGLTTEKPRAQGWKLHVAGSPAQAQQILTAAAGICEVVNIFYKFLPTTEEFAFQTQEQTGKWLAVYPNSPLQSMILACEIEATLRGAGIDANQLTPIPADRRVDLGFVYARYGSYWNKYIFDQRGVIVLDPKQNAWKPSWVEDIWLNYAAYTVTDKNAARSAVMPISYTRQYPATTAKFLQK